MCLELIMATNGNFRDSAKGCFGGAILARSVCRLDLRPVFQWPQLERTRRKEDTRRRNKKTEQGENRFGAVATPL